MIEIRIHGRGGQGGVTLAKIITTTRFLKGDSVQAFGIYAAERSGAPLQAFCRYDTETITNRNLIYEPDHVVVLDPSLVPLGITSGLKPGGWILINTPDPLDDFIDKYPGYRVATVNATKIARDNKLGTRTVPIVNTALAGAVANILELGLDNVHAALEHLGFVNGNLTASQQAYEQTQTNKQIDPSQADVKKPVIPDTRTPSFIEGLGGDMPRIKTGQWASEQPARQQMVPPCNHMCPAGNNVQGFLNAMAHDDNDEALRILLQTTPFPSVCGRVCPAPCMELCNRIQYDGAVNIRDLERAAGDKGNVTVKPIADRGEHIAIIGSGPAGLSAAYHLARLGYKTTMYESGKTIGGLLRTGIPEYRLPRDVLDREIKRILDLGVEVDTEHRIDRAELLELSKKHDAVLVATGLQEVRGLQLGIEDTSAVMQGIDFLVRVNENDIRVEGEIVTVVGGGNTAMDAARSALRLGAKSVHVIYRRTRQEMPAISEEIDQAIEEGIDIQYLTMPLVMKPINGDANSNLNEYELTCRQMQLGEPDESGRRRPVEIPDSDFTLKTNRMLLALGQSPDVSVYPEGTEVRDGGQLLGILEKPLFAIGDLATNEGTVTAAIGNGRRTALHIHQVFTGEQLLQPDHTEEQVIGLEQMRMHLFERAAQDHGVSLPPDTRAHTFDESHLGLADDPVNEAKRCLSCGVCNECDRCITYCPDAVITRVGHNYFFDYDHCKGCGVCVSECPRNVIFMSQL